MDHEHLGRDLLLLDDIGQELGRGVDVGRVERADSLSRHAAELHRELRIQRQVHVRPLQILHQVRQLVGHGAVPDLHVEKYQPAPLLRPAHDLVDELVRVTQPILAAGAGLPLRHRDDEVQRGEHLPPRIRLGPLGGGALELGQHLVRRQLAQDAHPGRLGIPVIGDDQVLRQQRARERLGAPHRPARRVGGRERVAAPLARRELGPPGKDGAKPGRIPCGRGAQRPSRG